MKAVWKARRREASDVDPQADVSKKTKPHALRPISGQTYAGLTVVALSLLTAYFISRTNGDVAAIPKKNCAYTSYGVILIGK